MNRKILLLVLCVVSTTAFCAGIQSPSQLRVSAVRYSEKLALVDALRVVGLHVLGGFVSFGVDIPTPTEPLVEVDIPDTTLPDALQRITSQVPGYTAEIVSEHVVEVYPGAERGNEDYPLNLSVREFSAKDSLA